MTTSGDATTLEIPSALLAEIKAAADRAHRPAAELVRGILERWLTENRHADQSEHFGVDTAKLTPVQAMEQILEVRKGTALPDGMTIRELMTHGRA